MFQPLERRENKGKGALARLAILISCFDMCSFCVAETLVHLLPVYEENQTDKFSSVSWGKPCNVCLLSQCHLCLCFVLAASSSGTAQNMHRGRRLELYLR